MRTISAIIILLFCSGMVGLVPVPASATELNLPAASCRESRFLRKEHNRIRSLTPQQAAGNALTPEFKLKKQPVRLIKVDENGTRYWYDEGVTNADAKALYLHFKNNADDPVPQIYGVPGMKGYFVVSSWDERFTDRDFGRRLYLVRKKETGFQDIDRTKGAGDSYNLTPVFFTGPDKILILAEIGTEYSWGLLVYELDRNHLSFLGSIAAAVEGEFDAVDPTPFAGVKSVDSRWIVEFGRDLVLDPGGLKEQSIRRKGNKPIVFEYDGKEFVLKEGTYALASNSGEQ